MDVEVQVCDIEPVVGEDTSRYTIQMPNGKTEVLDLCERHANPLVLLLARRAGATPLNPETSPELKVTPIRRARPATPPDSRRGGKARTITTVAAVERSKKG